ncbi:MULTISPECIES: hypothetical protein [unclassified Streptomyces]
MSWSADGAGGVETAVAAAQADNRSLIDGGGTSRSADVVMDAS